MSALAPVLGYGCAGVILAIPATLIAVRRGIRAGLLAGAITAFAVALIGLVATSVLAAIFGGGAFAVGFGEEILLVFLLLFFGPALLVGLAAAGFIRCISALRSKGAE